MSDRGSGDDQVDGDRRRQGHGDEQELSSKTLHIQSKRFYLDVKQNPRGRFVKLSEVTVGGRKGRLIFSMSTVPEFRDRLTEFTELYASLGPPNADKIPEDGNFKSEIIVKDTRRYYLDLRENPRGRFLRVSMTLSRSRQRSQVAIPAQGMIELRDALSDLLNEFGTDDNESENVLPEAKSMRVENKMFYFDVGVNRRGTYMRISEVRPNYRTAITIPQNSLVKFRDTFNEFIEKMEAASAAAGDKPPHQRSNSGSEKRQQQQQLEGGLSPAASPASTAIAGKENARQAATAVVTVGGEGAAKESAKKEAKPKDETKRQVETLAKGENSAKMD